ncbi:MAG TPA: hypothetical protein VEC18_02535 [Myxococcota bacterium]|nr:hypothetical protein [Myxococcota bacterium]
MPHRVVPSGNLAALTRLQGRNPRDSVTKTVGVVLRAREATRGACRPGRSDDTFSLRLLMVDDDGDVILDETQENLICDRAIGQRKFTAHYDVENCRNSVAPTVISRGTVRVTATTDDGQLVVDRTLLCQR